MDRLKKGVNWDIFEVLEMRERTGRRSSRKKDELFSFWEIGERFFYISNCLSMR